MILWKVAFQGWKERPVLGWGQENFLYVFSKYYDPALWKNEPWFDRAHNVFLDWLISAGILGLGAYLVMLGVTISLLFGAWKSGKVDRYIFAGLLSLLAAYLSQSLFVFDNLTSHLFFFAVLAWIQNISIGENISAFSRSVPIRARISLLGYFAVMVSAVTVGYSLVFFQVKPARAAHSIVNTMRIVLQHQPAGKIEAAINEAKRGIALDTFGTTEIRERIQQDGTSIFGDQAIAVQDKQKYLAFIVEELEKQRRENPYDVRAIVFLADTYMTAGRYQEAFLHAQEALRISPHRQSFDFIAAAAELSNNRQAEAMQLLQKAYQLDPQNPEAVHNIAAVLIASGRVKEGEDFLERHFGRRTVPYKKFVSAYERIGDLRGVVAVWETLVAFSPNNAQYRVDLGNAYRNIGEKEKAIAQFEKAIELEPSFKAGGEEIIRQIQQTVGR